MIKKCLHEHTAHAHTLHKTLESVRGKKMAHRRKCVAMEYRNGFLLTRAPRLIYFPNWKERKTNFKYMIYHAFFGIKKIQLSIALFSFVLIISLCAFVFSSRVSCKHSFFLLSLRFFLSWYLFFHIQYVLKHPTECFPLFIRFAPRA